VLAGVHGARAHATAGADAGDEHVVTPRDVRVEASVVPKKALAYCLVITVSPATGSRPAAKAARSGCAPRLEALSAGTLRKNTPPSRPARLVLHVGWTTESRHARGIEQGLRAARAELGPGVERGPSTR